MIRTPLVMLLAGAAFGWPAIGVAKGHRPAPLVESVFKVNTAPVSPHAKILLVAGSAATSAFSREIVDQRKLWLGAGFHEDEIECFYPVPLQEDLNDDPKRYLSLAPELAHCHAVTVEGLRAALHVAAAQKPKPPFLYVYLTSHGGQPISETLKEASEKDRDYWTLRRELKYPVFDQYQIVVEGLPDGTAMDTELLGALRAGKSADDLYLTPDNLRRMLADGFADVPKFVVIQGCFSGGFVEEPSARLSETLLSRLPRITVLSAARHDRSSFGCEAGRDTTFYGGVYNKALGEVIAEPRKIDWKDLSDVVASRVRELEKKKRVSPPSLPQFFSNQSPNTGL